MVIYRIPVILFLLLFSAPSTASEIVSPSSRDINGVHGGTPLTISHNTIFICYIDSALNVVIADRPLSSTSWRHTVVSTSSTDDAHNLCSIGIDSLGHIHAAFDAHSSPITYLRSTLPLNPTSMQPFSMEVWSLQITYPLFIRTGDKLLFLYRTGYAGNGSECLSQYDSTTSTWTSVLCPMIDGMGISSPYLAVPRVDGAGRLHLLWTNRGIVSPFNYGLYAAIYDPETQTLSPPEEVLSPLYRVSNVGLNILPTSTNPLKRLVTYLREVGTTFEVFSAHFPPTPLPIPTSPSSISPASSYSDEWRHYQISDERAPRLRVCPTGPDTPEPRTCDMQIQSPALVRLSPSDLLLSYGRAVAASPSGWARPAARTLASRSSDGGISWSSPSEAPFMPPRFCEMAEESSGCPLLLAQECGTLSGALHLFGIEDLISWGEPTSDFTFSSSNGWPIEGPDLFWTDPQRFSLDFTLRPSPSLEPMGLVDKSSTSGLREVRVVLWGNSPTGAFSYSPDHLQVAIGSAAGEWGLVWFPRVQVLPGEWTRLRIEWDGQLVQVFKDGKLVDQTAYLGQLKDTPVKLVVGGVRSSGTGGLVRPFKGTLRVGISPH